MDRRLGGVELSFCGWTDKNFSQRQRTRAELLVDRSKQKLGSAKVMRVGGVKVGNQHARIEHDHAGQSSRSCSR